MAENGRTVLISQGSWITKVLGWLCVRSPETHGWANSTFPNVIGMQKKITRHWIG